MEFGFLVKLQQNPLQISALQEPPPASGKCNNNNNVLELELKLPAAGDVAGDHENGGLVTPISGENKIPATLNCPPAPKKRKAAASPAKRKAMLGQRILLDLSKEIESLFPPELLADLGNKIKKVRQASDLIK